MRSFKSYAVAVLFLASCATDEEGRDNGILVTSEEQTNMRTPAEAMQIAQGAVSIFDDGPIQKSTGENNHLPRTIDYADGVKCITASQAVPSCGDTLMYVVNYTDNQGFAVVSASRNTEELLAVTENGHYNPDGTTIDNPGFRMFMEMAEDYVSNAILRHPPHKDTTRTDTFGLGFKVFMWDTTYSQVNIEPKVKVQWYQVQPEGWYCSNGHCGCAITAAAQAMSYYRFPSSIKLNYSGAPNTVTNLFWEGILAQHKHSNYQETITCSCNHEIHKQIGYLCRQLGKSSNSNYSNPLQTGTTINNIRTTLKNLGYTVSETQSYTNSAVLSNVNLDRILLVGGKTSTDAHMWLIDGCQQKTMIVKVYLVDPTYPVCDITTLRETYSTLLKDLVHINWGWGGVDNGYYNNNVFNTAQCATKDQKQNSAGETYTGEVGHTSNHSFSELNYFTIYHTH